MGESAETSEFEAASGKGAGDENFPVGSFLLPRHLRPHVATFYAYARAIDDIADNPDLAPEDKIARLSAFEEALLGKRDDPGLERASRMRQSLAAMGVSPRHCQDLISAFKQDAVKLRYVDWAELIDYCNRSAAPVGRYLLDLHGEAPADYPPCDALCNALQVINHLQDCQLDYLRLDRVYLPLEWVAAEGTRVEALDAKSASPELRRVLDRCLDGVEGLLTRAHDGPQRLKSQRLALETGAILELAHELTRRLRTQDPLARRVVLKKPEFALVGARGVGRTLLRRARAA
jgi:squalene synthase HpnC